MFKSDKSMRMLFPMHLSHLFLWISSPEVSVRFCWQTTVCLSSTRLVWCWHDRHPPMPVRLPSWPPWLYDPSRAASSRGLSQPAYMAISPPPSVCVGSHGHTYGLLSNARRTDLELLSVAGQWIVKIATRPKWSEPKTFDCPEPKPIYGSTPPPCAAYG